MKKSSGSLMSLKASTVETGVDGQWCGFCRYCMTKLERERVTVEFDLFNNCAISKTVT